MEWLGKPDWPEASKLAMPRTNTAVTLQAAFTQGIAKHPSGAKAPDILVAFAARVKPCLFKQSSVVLLPQRLLDVGLDVLFRGQSQLRGNYGSFAIDEERGGHLIEAAVRSRDGRSVDQHRIRNMSLLDKALDLLLLIAQLLF